MTDFDGASQRIIERTPSTAELCQDVTAFATTFALPNFFFLHLSMALLAILRRGGADIGK